MQLTKKSDWFSNLVSDVFEDRKPFDSLKKNVLPAVNISENDDEFLIEVCAPGINKEDVKVNITEDMITVNYKIEEKKEESGKNYLKKEYSYSSFERKASIPKNVLQDKITANFTDGILTIKLPKDASKKPETKEIPIE